MADCNFSPCYPFADSFIFGKSQFPPGYACKVLFLHIYCAVFLWPKGNCCMREIIVLMRSISSVKKLYLCCCNHFSGVFAGAGAGNEHVI
ncbi:hypothetical protein MNBD_GAMMA11-1705 [hydrothermal vent metagenome]|uniref:Uncharacterized protein n=1 Tax=hydrothermal vent metagenome TaxID=652676 RepID=A0A3B0XLT2_9ZZZZ